MGHCFIHTFDFRRLFCPNCGSCPLSTRFLNLDLGDWLKIIAKVFEDISCKLTSKAQHTIMKTSALHIHRFKKSIRPSWSQNSDRKATLLGFSFNHTGLDFFILMWPFSMCDNMRSRIPLFFCGVWSATRKPSSPIIVSFVYRRRSESFEILRMPHVCWWSENIYDYCECCWCPKVSEWPWQAQWMVQE